MSILSKQFKPISRPQQRGPSLIKAMVVLLCPPVVIGLLTYHQINIVLVLGGIIFLGLLALMFVQPETTTVVVFFVLYSNLTVVAVKHHGVPEIIAASFFLLLGIPLLNYLLIRRQKIITNRIFFLMIVYLGVILISAAVSRDTEGSIDRIVGYVIEGIILYFLIFNTVRTPDALRKGIWALIAAGILMGSVSLYQELTGSYDNDFGGFAQTKDSEIDTGREDYLGQEIQRRRLAGPVGSKNRYAQIMVVLLPLAIFRIWAERSWILRIIAAASCVPIISGALLTFSRGAGVSIIITLLAMVYLRTIKLWHFIFVALAASLIVLATVPDYVYRITTVANVGKLVSGEVSEADGAVRGRATVNLAAINIFLDYPILGVGPGQTNDYTATYGNEVGFRRLVGERRAHNMYLEELADTGFVGFTLFMSIVLLTMYQLTQVRRHWLQSRPDIAHTASGFLLAIVAYLSTAVFLHLSYVRYYWLVLALAGTVFHIFGPVSSTEAEPDDKPIVGVQGS